MSAEVRAYEVTALEDRFWVSSESRRFVEAAGMSRAAQWKVALCVAELASNVAKHAGSGWITVRLLGRRRGISVRAEDRGPGIASPDKAMLDGYSEGRWMTPDDPGWLRNGLGAGLGTIARAMSEVRIQARVGGGVAVEAVLWTHE